MRTVHADLLTAQKKAQMSIPGHIELRLRYGTIDDLYYPYDRILAIPTCLEERYGATAEIVLDNWDNTIFPGLTSVTNYMFARADIGFGYICADGTKRYDYVQPLYVQSEAFHSFQGRLLCILSLRGIFDIMDIEEASVEYIQPSSDTDSIKDVIDAVCQATIAPYTHCQALVPTFDSYDARFDTYVPADGFRIRFKESRLSVLKRLLYHTKTVMRVESDDSKIHFFVPIKSGDTWVALTAYALREYVQPASPNNNFTYKCTTAGDSGASEPTWPTTAGGTVADGTVTWTAEAPDYEYRLAVSGYHTFDAKTYLQSVLMPNRFEVESHLDDAGVSGDRYSGSAEDTDHSDLTPPTPWTSGEIRTFSRMRLASNAEAASVAAVLRDHARIGVNNTRATVPINAGSEIWDWVSLTDSRQSGVVSLGNINYIDRQYEQGKTWQMDFGFGDILQSDLQWLIGTLARQEEEPLRQIIHPPRLALPGGSIR